jgi:hypothetical protein
MLAQGVFGTGVPLIIAVLFICPAALIVIGTVTWANRFVTSRNLFRRGRARQPRLGQVRMTGGPTKIARETILLTATAGKKPSAPTQTFASHRNSAQRDFRLEPGPIHQSSDWEQSLPRPIAVPAGQPSIDLLARLATVLDGARDVTHGTPAADIDEIGAFDPTVTESRNATLHSGEVPTEGDAIQKSESARAGEPLRMDEPREPPSVTDPDFNGPADQDFADIGTLLKAAIRDLDQRAAALSAEVPQPMMTTDPQSAGLPIVAAPAAANPARAKPNSIYQSLETEMASGRPYLGGGAAKDRSS